MAELTLSPWTIGIDNVSPETGLPEGAAVDALNVDFDRVGGFASRPGYTELLADIGMHSLWTSRGGQSYCVRDGALCSATCNGSVLATTALHTLTEDRALSFAEVNDSIVAMSEREGYEITAGVIRHLGIENPGGVVVRAETYGGLYAGRYAVATSFLRGSEESGLSYGAFAQVPAAGGLRLTIPQPVEGEVTGIRLYRTQANGDVYYRVTDLPLGLTSYLLGVTDLGRPADNQFLERIICGQLVRYWRGHLLVARGRNLFFSEPLRYGLYSPVHGFVQFEGRVTLLEPVEGGVFVGGSFGVRFLTGDRPGAWTHQTTDGQAPIAGSGTSIEAAELGGQLALSGKRYALWLAGNGYVLGAADGNLMQVQGSRIRLSASAGRTMVRQRRAVTVVS